MKLVQLLDIKALYDDCYPIFPIYDHLTSFARHIGVTYVARQTMARHRTQR